jgi:SAM-dependent methyltransferase
MAAAGVRPTDRVLDIGCGTGQTTHDAAGAATSGAALGVDLSTRMLDLARQVADREGIANAGPSPPKTEVPGFVRARSARDGAQLRPRRRRR